MSGREPPHSDSDTDTDTDTDPGPVLPTTTRDETEEGWGDRPSPAHSDDERYLRERPPHHES